MRKYSIVLMIYGEPGSTKSVFTEEKYKELAAAFVEEGFDVRSVCYHDSMADTLEKELIKFPATLVWVNPIEQQADRKRLDELLKRISEGGCFVSAHPDTILKIGTKEILYKVKDEEFGADVKLYNSFDEFRQKFSIDANTKRILKYHRGNGGNGVFKIDGSEIHNNEIIVTPASKDDEETRLNPEDFYSFFRTYFSANSLLIDQEWNPNIVNGMVRCYLSGSRVAGFGYQEVNALYPKIDSLFKKPGQRFYFSENCGLFRDLKEIMETSWVSRLQKVSGLEADKLPVIWDADFFINNINSKKASEKYSLCEINVSSVSPFPPSAIPYMIQEVKKSLGS